VISFGGIVLSCGIDVTLSPSAHAIVLFLLLRYFIIGGKGYDDDYSGKGGKGK
jgi:hypothetical protein